MPCARLSDDVSTFSSPSVSWFYDGTIGGLIAFVWKSSTEIAEGRASQKTT
jgi:hypothetical protein